MTRAVSPLSLIAEVPIQADEPTSSPAAPLVAHGVVFHATNDRLIASDAVSGVQQWSVAWNREAARQTGRLTVDHGKETVYATSEDAQRIRALSLHSGEMRWTTRLPEGHAFPPHNRYAQTDTRLYTAVERIRPYRQSALMALDTGTGTRVRSAATTAPAQDIRLGGGHLLVLESLRDLRPGYSSSVLVARDPDTLVTRWRMVVSGRGAADGGHIVTHGDQAWIGSTSGSGFIACADLNGGSERWRVDGVHAHSLTLAAGSQLNGVLILFQQGASLVALDAESGRRVWRSDLGRTGAGSTCYANGVVYHSRDSWLYALDVQTGRALATTESPSGTGLSVWSDGERVCWSTEWGVQIYEAAPHD